MGGSVFDGVSKVGGGNRSPSLGSRPLSRGAVEGGVRSPGGESQWVLRDQVCKL